MSEIERFSDRAIEIINELHRERLDYESEYLPLIEAVNRLAELENKIESGQLVDLPCKVGDTVYWAWILEREQAEVIEGKIRGLSISHNGTEWFSVVYNNGLTFEHTFKDDWNKTVFLTKAQAEARLKELKGE